MFDNAGLVARGQQQRNSPPCGDSEVAPALLAELEQLRVRVARKSGSEQIDTGGVPCEVQVGQVLNSEFAAQRLQQALRHFMRNDVAVTLSLTQLNLHASAMKSLQLFCEFLGNTLSQEKFAAQKIGLSLSSHQIPLQAFMVITNSILGSGPRFVYLDSLQMRQHCNEDVQSATNSNWQFLWHQRHFAERILPIYGGLVRSACPLLADEIAGAILPGTAMVVPGRSAWLPLELCLADFLGADGQVDWQRLSPMLEKTVRIGEQLQGELSWPCWRQRADAKLHRRLAISITGIGDLVRRSGRNPRSLDCLIWLTTVIKRIRDELMACSATLAQEVGALPAVLREDPSVALNAGTARDSWRQRWNSAVRSSALRHRNLLVLSPYAVLPGNAERSADFSDLLPVIRFADAWSFATTATFVDWSSDDYQRFHRRAWAVIQGQNEGCVVAAGV
jgi:hypothetical protein